MSATTHQVVIVDYGVGNLLSVKNMFKKIGVEAVVSSDPLLIADAPRLLIPGVGAFDYGMAQLHATGLTELLNKKVLQDKVPTLGICLGLQLMTRRSEEGKSPGLAWFDADTVLFQIEDKRLKVPHMGWSDVMVKKDSRLFDGMYEEPRFYFVHSYHLKADHPSDVLVTANYGYEFVCGLEKDNLAGVQFHPEKSHKYGMKLLRNFIDHF